MTGRHRASGAKRERLDRTAGRVAHGAATTTPHVQAADAGLTHEPGHPLLVHHQPQAQCQFGMHPRRPVGFSRLLVDFGDAFEQQCVVLVAGRRRTVVPFVITGPGHAEQPTGHRDINTVVGEFVDQPERYFGRTFSLAKYAAARLRISFSISS